MPEKGGFPWRCFAVSQIYKSRLASAALLKERFLSLKCLLFLPMKELAADFHQDGNVNIQDTILINQYLSN